MKHEFLAVECLSAFLRGPDWVAETDAERETQRQVSAVGALLIVEGLENLRRRSGAV